MIPSTIPNSLSTNNPIPFIDLKSQYIAYKDEMDEAIQRVLNSAQFIMGPEITALEEQLAEFVGPIIN